MERRETRYQSRPRMSATRFWFRRLLILIATRQRLSLILTGILGTGRNRLNDVDEHPVRIPRDEVPLPEQLVAQRDEDRQPRRFDLAIDGVWVLDLEIEYQPRRWGAGSFRDGVMPTVQDREIDRGIGTELEVNVPIACEGRAEAEMRPVEGCRAVYVTRQDNRIVARDSHGCSILRNQHTICMYYINIQAVCMQQTSPRRSNRERTETTRTALLDAARTLIVRNGYAGTSTPEIASEARVTRGALYHHFADKRDLFRAVLEREAEAVAAQIRDATPAAMPAMEALLAGSLAYLDAMAIPGRTRLLLVDGPAVLGLDEIAAIDAAHSARTLQEGLEAVMAASGDRSIPIPALAVLLSAAFDRAALAIEAGSEPNDFRSAVLRLVERVVASVPG